MNDRLDAGNARIWGGESTYVAVAEVGDTFTVPADLTTPVSGFQVVGWMNQEGLKLTPTDEMQDLKGLQGGRVIRVVNTSSATAFTFTALESKEMNIRMVLGAGESTEAGDLTKHKFGASRQVQEKQFVAATFDGEIVWLWHFPRAAITEAQEITLDGENITAYQVTLKLLEDYVLYTQNDPGMEV